MYLSGHSVNDHIPKALCSLCYIIMNSAMTEVQELDKGTLLTKVNIKSTFAVHPADRYVLAMN